MRILQLSLDKSLISQDCKSGSIGQSGVGGPGSVGGPGGPRGPGGQGGACGQDGQCGKVKFKVEAERCKYIKKVQTTQIFSIQN